MLQVLKMPPQVENQLQELYELCEENPVYLPLPKVAGFLGAKAEGLRDCIEKGQCPFGIAWQRTLSGNKAFKIPTATFFLWYTQGMGYKE